jgi:uncharacterized protein YaiI (UPF0178 family)
MKIFLDADACPKVIKDALFKVATKRKIPLTLVADKFIQVPNSEFITFIKVSTGMDAADDKIVELINDGDLLISEDIPLADRAVSKGALVVSMHGNLLDERNIKERLSIRDMMAEMRDAGMETSGQRPFSDKDRQNFINQLDKVLTKLLKK